MSKRVELLALGTIPRIMPGDDLAGVILAACDREGAGLLPDDVLVVAQKVVSKAEGRIARLADVEASPEALRLAQISAKDPRIVELILRESEVIVRCVPGLIIARHRLGVVLANAGIDQSNIGAGDEAETALLWPLDPDASAERLRREIAERRGTTTAAPLTRPRRWVPPASCWSWADCRNIRGRAARPQRIFWRPAVRCMTASPR